MPIFRVTDPTTGMTLKLTGDSPPTEQELNEVFGSLPSPTAATRSSGATRSWEEQPGIVSRVGSKLGEAYQAATNPDYSMSRKAVRSFGTLGEAAGDVIGEGAKLAFNATTTPTGRDTLKQGAEYLAGTDVGKAQKGTFNDMSRAWEGVRLVAPETATDIEKAIQIPNLIPAYAAGKIMAPAAKEAALIGVDTATLAGRGAKKAIGAMIPEKLPQKILESGAKWSTTLTPEVRKNLSKTMFEEKIPLSPKGYEKLNSGVAGINREIKSALEPYADTPIDAKKVVERTSEARTKAERSYDAAGEIAKVDEEAAKFLDNWDGKLTVADAQKVKQDIYKQLKGHYDSVAKGGTGKYTDGEIGAMKNIARGLKEEIETTATDAPIKELNARETKLLKLEPHLRRAVGRIENHNILSLDDVLAATAGTVIGAATGGPVGAAVGAAAAGVAKRALGAPVVKSSIGQGLYNLKQPLGTPKLVSGTAKGVIEGATGGMEESLGVLTPAKNQPAVKLVQAGPNMGDAPKLQRDLTAIDEKITALEATVPTVINFTEISRQLQQKGIPFMQVVKESKQDFHDRILAQYKKSIGPDVPTIKGTEPPGLKTLRERKGSLQERLAIVQL